jgi:hypothetical protein
MTDATDKVDELDGVGIRVGGALVAWFADPEQASEWATEVHYGNWLMHPCKMPNRPPFTKEQIAAARKAGAEMLKKLQPGRVAE